MKTKVYTIKIKILKHKTGTEIGNLKIKLKWTNRNRKLKQTQ